MALQPLAELSAAVRKNFGVMRAWNLSALILARCVKRLLHGGAGCSKIRAAVSSAAIEVLAPK